MKKVLFIVLLISPFVICASDASRPRVPLGMLPERPSAAGSVEGVRADQSPVDGRTVRMELHAKYGLSYVIRDRHGKQVDFCDVGQTEAAFLVSQMRDQNRSRFQGK